MYNRDVLVSIIMPLFNAEKFVAEAIDSILNQTHSNIELIVVDDNSTDDTENRIRAYAENKPYIKYFRHKKLSHKKLLRHPYLLQSDQCQQQIAAHYSHLDPFYKLLQLVGK